MTDHNGQWDWNRILLFLLEHVLQKIATIRPPTYILGEEIPGWRWEQNRSFSTKSAYEFLSTSEDLGVDFNWSKIWSLKLRQHVKVFTWLAAHDRLLSNAERFLRHLSTSDRCPFCQSNSETTDHILRHCSTVVANWIVVIEPNRISEFFQLLFNSWLQVNIIGGHQFAKNKDNWGERFVVYIWMLWKNRCSRIFNEDFIQRGDFRLLCDKLFEENVTV
ncbi:hypothetical protein V6N11_074157 [Hibiscus sabdariffa]|uniref:Reverse transcriptase zinc-binding domain-containing protein n=2 Tax=Hibiscus sabdariffa TaxID=183260 RepID=A0ABR2AMK1_9ROSI